MKKYDAEDDLLPVSGGAFDGYQVRITAGNELVIQDRNNLATFYQMEERFEGTERHLRWVKVNFAESKDAA